MTRCAQRKNKTKQKTTKQKYPNPQQTHTKNYICIEKKENCLLGKTQKIVYMKVHNRLRLGFK